MKRPSNGVAAMGDSAPTCIIARALLVFALVRLFLVLAHYVSCAQILIIEVCLEAQVMQQRLQQVLIPV